MGIIYGLYCLCHDYEIRYVGQTSRKMTERMRSYRSAVKDDKPWPVIHWMKKHGLDNIAWEILEEVVDVLTLNEREVLWIAEKNTFSGKHGLNATQGGGGVRGFRKSDAQRQAQSERVAGSNHHQWGKPLTEETRARISQALKGRQMTTEHIAKLAQATANRVWTDESRARSSKARKQYMSDSDNRRHLSELRRGNPAYSGENAPAAKLDYEKAREIREKFATGNYSKAELARMYEVSPGTIGNVVFNRKWVADGI